MKPEVKKRWVDALRSDTYEQTEGGLRNQSNEFCCLGVLCDLYARETGEPWEPPSTYYGNYRFYDHDELLPVKVVTWAGLETEVSYATTGGDIAVVLPDDELDDEDDSSKVTLSELNDAGYSFDRIAGIIEASL